MPTANPCFVSHLTLLRRARATALVAVVLAIGVAVAQPKEFPADAAPVTTDSLKGLAGKKFVGKRADGKTWTMDFGPDFAYRLTAQDGILDGKVRLDGEKLCQDMRKTLESSCNDVRLKDNMLFYKRNSNGEVVTLVAQ
ncbi:hypothetical protein AB4Z46_07965 [Variovorax sp. M-6]|uniref:hypothetical protein n=1 Tax=Variovorax sp. M-6 TaxID=3233041 RepID=UPI003F956DEB